MNAALDPPDPADPPDPDRGMLFGTHHPSRAGVRVTAVLDKLLKFWLEKQAHPDNIRRDMVRENTQSLEDLENNTADIKEFTNFEADKASETYSKVTYPHSQDPDNVFSGEEIA